MPKALERKLKKEASSRGLKGSHADAYVYGTMRKTGWKPKREVHIPGGSMHEVVNMDYSAPGGTPYGGY